MNARHRGVSTEPRTDIVAEGPLRRWARRKREAAREKSAADETRRPDEPRDASEAVGEARDSTDEAPEAAVAAENVLTDEDMPPLESLDEDSDYSGFLSSGVSEALRRRALRKLFSSAVFNIPDGLDDYDDDFTSFAALGDIVTSDMKHQAEMEAERAKQAQARAGAATGVEEESGGAEDERPAPASDDAVVRADAGASDGTEPSEPAAFAAAVPPDSIVDEDPARNGERSAPPASAGGHSRESLAGAGPPEDAQADDDVEVAGRASSEASCSGESAASASHSNNGSHASAGREASVKADKVEHRGA